MGKVRANRWVAIIRSLLFLFVAGTTVESAKPISDSLNNFASSNGPAIDRERIYTVLFAVTENQQRVGAAIKISDNLYLTASHILSADLSKNSIRSYMTSESFALTVLAQDDHNDIALLQTQETDTPRSEPLIKLADAVPRIEDTVSYFLLLPQSRSESYDVELHGKQPLVDKAEQNEIYLGRLIAPQGSFTYEIEGFVLPYDLEGIEAHLERNQLAENPLYGPEILGGPDYVCMTTINGFNGASGGGVFKKTTDGYELAGILTVSVTERHLISIPKSPRGFTRLQQNYSFFTHRKAIVDLVKDYTPE